MTPERYNRDLFDFIDASPTPFHAVAWLTDHLKRHGFIELVEADPWDLKPGHRYFLTRNQSSIIAFSLGNTPVWETGLRIAGAHTDSPCLRVKPKPELTGASCLRLGVEVYGGTLLNTWFDRGLNLAGRAVCLIDDNSGSTKPISLLVDFKRPVGIIPSLAIHLDRDANKDRTVNPQLHVLPLVQLVSNGNRDSIRQILSDQLAIEHPDMTVREVLDFELMFVDSQGCANTGIDGGLLSAPRLDNLLSCHAAVKALIQADPAVSALVLLSDHEEIGSETAPGARGSFLESILDRLTGTTEHLAMTEARSFMISCDNSHALHPSFSDRHDANHQPLLNQGPVLKINASKRYATDAVSASLFRLLCRRANVGCQDFVMRSDLSCGSTIGPAVSARTGIRTVDAGAPTLAMHSVRELTGKNDPIQFFRVLECFFTLPALPFYP